MIQMVRLRESSMIALADTWEDRGGGIIVAHYSTGQASISGPMAINGPVNVYWEVHCENQATANLLAGASMSTRSLKSLARSSPELRALVRGQGRGLIRNSAMQIVGYLPRHVISGSSAEQEFLDGEDVDGAEVIPGLE